MRLSGIARTLALALIPLVLASCDKRSSVIEELFTMEGRAAKGAPPQEIEDLKAGIDQYLKEAERTIAATEKIGTYYRILVSRYVSKGMHKEAYEAALKALEYYPANTGLFYSAGLSAGYVAKSQSARGPAGETERLRWLAIAEGNYRRVLDSDPRNGRALYALAVLYEFELDRPMDAVPLLRQLLEIETRNIDAMLLLGRCLYRLGRLEEAADMYETAAKTASGGGRMNPSSVDRKAAAESNRDRILEELYGKQAKP